MTESALSRLLSRGGMSQRCKILKIQVQLFNHQCTKKRKRKGPAQSFSILSSCCSNVLKELLTLNMYQGNYKGIQIQGWITHSFPYLITGSDYMQNNCPPLPLQSLHYWINGRMQPRFQKQCLPVTMIIIVVIVIILTLVPFNAVFIKGCAYMMIMTFIIVILTIIPINTTTLLPRETSV